MAKKTDTELKAMTNILKQRYKQGETLDELLPEAFATIREADWRVLGLKPYPVQILSGIILHQGRLAEQKTGEGKTLVTTMPAYLNALTGKSVHIVTVNDYLAQRDKDQMSKVYAYLGLETGCITQDLDNAERKTEYRKDIVYATNNELGFDYLRDNMVRTKEERVMTELNYAIVDEVDSILIDEARTPLIISGPGDKPSDLYLCADQFVQTLKGKIKSEKEIQEDRMNREFNEEDYDFIIYKKDKAVILTEKGTKAAETFFSIDNLSDMKNMALHHHINQALRAHCIMKRDIDYIVKDNEILIVDTFTGRTMEGRRYSDGLHQAIECKEGIEIKPENKTLATITFQNFFKLYEKLAGMSGTIVTERSEFDNTYNLDIIEVPTNKPIIREDFDDRVYKTLDEKFKAITEDVKCEHETGRPVLIGTASIEKSEQLANYLSRAKIPYRLLNAKHHEQEAGIIAQAGRLNAVTIATNMAGRGTDILLGGNPEYLAKEAMKGRGYTHEEIEMADSFYETDDEDTLALRTIFQMLSNQYKKDLKPEKEKVVELGGLYVIGTERHDARRIDNQLIGRSGRQGDPGKSQFYLSAEDDLMRLFGGERFQEVMKSYIGTDSGHLKSAFLTRSIASAQKKVEGLHEGMRKNTLDYDQVMNKQRTVMYEERNKLIDRTIDIEESFFSMRATFLDSIFETAGQDEEHDEFIIKEINRVFDFLFDHLDKEQMVTAIKKRYDELKENFGPTFNLFLESLLLDIIDQEWMDHIDAMEQLKQGIGLRGISGQNPVQAYAKEGFELFDDMTQRIIVQYLTMVYHVQFIQDGIL